MKKDGFVIRPLFSDFLHSVSILSCQRDNRLFSGLVLHFDIVYLRPGRQNDRIDRPRFLPIQQYVILHPWSGKGRTAEAIQTSLVQRHRIHRKRKVFIGRRANLRSGDMRSQNMIGQMHRQFIIALCIRRESFAQKEQHHRKTMPELIVYIGIMVFLRGQQVHDMRAILRKDVDIMFPFLFLSRFSQKHSIRFHVVRRHLLIGRKREIGKRHSQLAQRDTGHCC